uniref:Uncharacterized protein n=1 Tax=Leptocylindrus danicus TaxID=163516 RepID=A0A7S2P0L9_9STRA|mmetsp:Transcript_19513/g.29043  ORF Transcript_19513/g.29043 Transcript_19513/m.29043 type:complete len:170 (+) Transcript_19513:394-903(+)|eukprot:CAMPEP_0116018512 /NCGR_PEP_ID=MMETSP0321-20121206/8691_1 /TAXON_ID=163516 /ORGANISM="Leptocylindrus danicus var. danicus, Strain B650" /LENGTH=169 /DNA_ID=CAMNT_0003488917 /DNA_START=726 /DNA_END=1235 /DNA_ORIENTATION=+
MASDNEAKIRSILGSKPENERLENMELVARLSAFDQCFASNEHFMNITRTSRRIDDYSMAPSAKRQRLKSIMESPPFSCEVIEATLQDRLAGAFGDIFETVNQKCKDVLESDSKDTSAHQAEAGSILDISAIVGGEETTTSQTQVERAADRTVRLYMLQYVSKSIGSPS